MNDPRPELDAEAGRLEEDVLYSEKAHFGMATFWGRVHFFLGIPSALAAAASGVSAFRSEPLVAASLAVISAFLTGLLTFLDPKKVAATHHAAGVEYADLRGRLRRLRAIDLWGGADLKVCRCELEKMAAQKSALARSTPHTGGLAYILAKRSIEKGEHGYAVDKEAPGMVSATEQ